LISGINPNGDIALPNRACDLLPKLAMAICCACNYQL
jgi:hypothetical protein